MVELFLSIFISSDHFHSGSVALFRVTLGMLKMREEDLTNCDNSALIFNCLSDIPGDITGELYAFTLGLMFGMIVTSNLNTVVWSESYRIVRIHQMLLVKFSSLSTSSLSYEKCF